MAVYAIAAIVVLAGCDKSTSTPAPAESSISRASPTVSVDPTAEAALAAYRGMWDAWVEAGKTSDPDAEELRTYASGDALKTIVSALLTHREQGEVSLGEISIDPQIASVDSIGTPAVVAVSDCVNAEQWLMYKTTGELVDDEPGGKHNMTATVTPVDNLWKVTYFELGRSGTC